MFLWFELSFSDLYCVNTLDSGINLSRTEITEQGSYAFADFWSLNGETILMGASHLFIGYLLFRTLILSNFHFNKMSLVFSKRVLG